MESPWLLAYLVLAGAAVVQSLLVVLQAWEHRRYARSCMNGLDSHRADGRAMVIVPCKGRDVDLEDNLRWLLRQDYGDYEVTFVVESSDDPACAAIRRVMGEHPGVVSRLVVAGRATDCGQKVHNLRAATATLPPAVRYLVFADSDARPRPEWLRVAVARLCAKEADAAAGYRWFIPCRPSLANHLLYSINCGIMSLLARRSRLLWGGSWAIRRETFDEIGLHAAWQGTLSDDLVAGRVLRAKRREVRFEPAMVVASPLDMSLGEMLSFIRRQYLIAKCYVPGWWTFALLVISLGNVAWLCTVAAVVLGLARGGLSPAVPAAVAAVLYVLRAARGWIMQDLPRTYFPERLDSLRRARRSDLWLGPIAGMVHWFGITSSVFGRHITWRNIRYRLFRGGAIKLESRDDDVDAIERRRAA